MTETEKLAQAVGKDIKAIHSKLTALEQGGSSSSSTAVKSHLLVGGQISPQAITTASHGGI